VSTDPCWSVCRSGHCVRNLVSRTSYLQRRFTRWNLLACRRFRHQCTSRVRFQLVTFYFACRLLLFALRALRSAFCATLALTSLRTTEAGTGFSGWNRIVPLLVL